MNATRLIVVFGAVVRPDGSPSASLLRRARHGAAAAMAHPDAPVLCSGGACRPGGPSEASIIARVLIEQGVAPARLVLDEASLSTLDNVEATVAQVRIGGHMSVIACSDAYHLPRIRILLALHGVRSLAWPCAESAPFGHRLAMGLRESLAIPYNLFRAMARRARRRS